MGYMKKVDYIMMTNFICYKLQNHKKINNQYFRLREQVRVFYHLFHRKDTNIRQKKVWTNARRQIAILIVSSMINDQILSDGER